MTPHTHHHETSASPDPEAIIDNLVARTEANHLEWIKGHYCEDYTASYHGCTIRVWRVIIKWQLTIHGADRKEIPCPVRRRDIKRLGRLVHARYKSGQSPQHAAVLNKLAQ